MALNEKQREEMLSLWEQVHFQNKTEDISISEDIRDSWERSKQHGVDPFIPKNYYIITKKELGEKTHQNKELLNAALPAMEEMYSLLKEFNFCTVIADNKGFILKRIGEEYDLVFTGGHNFVEGSNWSEEVMGTNAVGLALAIDKPCTVYGYEHYCRCASTSACFSVPIHDTKNNILGVLNLTCPYIYASNSVHTLGMVVSAAKAIEREIALQIAYQTAINANIHLRAIMESIIEGLIAMDQKFTITHINNRACDMLEINLDNCMGKNIKDVLGYDNNALLNILSSGKKVYGETIFLGTMHGKKKFLVNCTPLDKTKEINFDLDSPNLPSKTGAVLILHEIQEFNRMVNRIVGARPKTNFKDLIGKCNSFQFAVDQAKMAAETSSNVILLGESGVGKDLFAQAIHNASQRAREPFFAINCAAIPRELISSELFGYEEGAFTGAKKGGNPGKFELANMGSIFLDEIGEMPLDLQASLLRVLEEQTVMRLGGREVIPINVRLISATNKELQEEIVKGHFRPDLFYRLAVISIRIPPLRERKEDIPDLVEFFIRFISSKLDRNIKKVDPKVMDLLLNYNWPGNIRQLRNVIERIINLSKYDTLTVDLLPPELHKNVLKISANPFSQEVPSKENVEEQLIRDYLDKYHYNKSDTAKALKISRSSLYRKMEKYGIK
ncbi:Limonene hydroxylase [Pelotomaculum schinkii]|uniref:Limonene hydroxylase n=1 Tax=Pelotomaculum schinkii TaxID=78350 RepID=A0A4Y7RIG9_9FIRM|nr:sigma 54-interacting transcriptional regulator [Pelotomaculum schinkii]TEB08540.1 Limonene hydroxylase [Pelotomaculum schinkii]